MKEHQIDGISLSKWRRLKEMLDQSKRFPLHSEAVLRTFYRIRNQKD